MHRVTIEEIREDAARGAAWYLFEAWNQQSLCGFGSAEDAEKYADCLNRGRDVGLYHATEITDDEMLLRLSNGEDSDGFALDLELDAIAENDEWVREERTREGMD
jgi:hypothetical protein